MKKFLSFAMISAAALIATPAMASTVSFDLSKLTIAENVNGPVNQTAISVAARVGSVGNNDTVDSTAATIANNGSLDATISQSASFLDANGLVSGMTQNVNGSLNQMAVSLAGTGSTGSYSSLTSTAATIGNNASMTVKVKQ